MQLSNSQFLIHEERGVCIVARKTAVVGWAWIRCVPSRIIVIESSLHHILWHRISVLSSIAYSTSFYSRIILCLAKLRIILWQFGTRCYIVSSVGQGREGPSICADDRLRLLESRYCQQLFCIFGIVIVSLGWEMGWLVLRIDFYPGGRGMGGPWDWLLSCELGDWPGNGVLSRFLTGIADDTLLLCES